MTCGTRLAGRQPIRSEGPHGTPSGIAAVVPDETAADTANLVGMWVDPGARGTGVADELILQVFGWAGERAYRAVRLHATEGNVRAERAYHRHGFRRTGRTFLRGRDGLVEFEMERPLRETP